MRGHGGSRAATHLKSLAPHCLALHRSTCALRTPMCAACVGAAIHRGRDQSRSIQQAGTAWHRRPQHRPMHPPASAVVSDAADQCEHVVVGAGGLLVESRIPFVRPIVPAAPSAQAVVVDVDGDMDVPRVRRRHSTIRLRHFVQSNVEDVGLQLWRGAFVLADWILHAQVLRAQRLGRRCCRLMRLRQSLRTRACWS